MEFEEIDRSVNLDARAGVFCRLFGVFEELRRARFYVAWKQHRCHAAITRAVEFFGELDGFLHPFAAACIVPVVFQPTLTVVKEADVFVTRTGGATDADLIHHVDILLRLSSRAADLECRGSAALQNVDQRKSLAHVTVSQMRDMSALARGPAVG